MRGLLNLLMILVLATGMSSCGNKGKVRSPDQIAAADAKKAKKAARQADDESPEADDTTLPTPDVGANGNTAPTPKQKQPVVNAPTGTSAGRISIIANPAQEGEQ